MLQLLEPGLPETSNKEAKPHGPRHLHLLTSWFSQVHHNILGLHSSLSRNPGNEVSGAQASGTTLVTPRTLEHCLLSPSGLCTESGSTSAQSPFLSPSLFLGSMNCSLTSTQMLAEVHYAPLAANQLHNQRYWSTVHGGQADLS